MRTLNAKLDAALRQKVVRPIIMWELLGHPAGDLRIWSGIGTLTYNGYTWVGGSVLVSSTAHEDATEVKVPQYTLSLQLPDVSQEALNIITTPVKRLVINRYRAFLDQNSQVIPDAILQFRGYTDAPTISEDGNGGRLVNLLILGPITQLVKPLSYQLSHEEQIKRYPGDSGLSLMSSIPNQSLSWQAGAYNGFVPP